MGDSDRLSKNDMTALRADLAFTCVHENSVLPKISDNAEILFKYGRFLERQDDDKAQVARLYRIASASGNYKANRNLQILVSTGEVPSPNAPVESVDLAQQLIDAKIPIGYYDMAGYLLQGYGVKQDSDLARRYMRKAADMGNPDAQAYVADLLAPIDAAPNVARQMRRCAASQGNASAANRLGFNLKTDKLYPDALAAFQEAVEAGDAPSTFLLHHTFLEKDGATELYMMGVKTDDERAARYMTITTFLLKNQYKNPKVPDINDIVPLPPAKLPHWDGTFQWQKEQDAGAPEKPSEQLIEEMAKAKHLDPATGLPLKGANQTSQESGNSATLAERVPLGTFAKSRAVCPEDGVWCAKIAPGQIADNTRRFLQGQTLPSLIVHEPRKLAVIDKVAGVRQDTIAVTWELVSYLDNA
jgi:tetratricopeptide (TPR) repeat protein